MLILNGMQRLLFLGLLVAAIPLLVMIFLISWRTLFHFSDDSEESAIGGAIIAVGSVGLWYITYFVLQGLNAPFVWVVLLTTEFLAVSVGISYLILSRNKKKEVLSGAIIYGIVATLLFIFFKFAQMCL